MLPSAPGRWWCALGYRYLLLPSRQTEAGRFCDSLKVFPKGIGGLPWEVSGEPGWALGTLACYTSQSRHGDHLVLSSVTGSGCVVDLCSPASFLCLTSSSWEQGRPGSWLPWLLSVLTAFSHCLRLNVGLWVCWCGWWLGPQPSTSIHVHPHPVLCRVRWEEFPFRAQLRRRGQRGERDGAIGLRIWWSEVLSLLAPLRATVSVATDQRATAGGAQQDQSGRCEWRLSCAQQVADGIG